MKILFFTDTHIRGTNPKNRMDDFVESLENKFLEIGDIAEERKVDYIFHGGDLFDRPDVAISIVGRFANIIKKYKKPIYTISGNHDIFGQNPKTLNRTMLGFLNSIGLINVIDEKGAIILEKDGTKIQLTGQPYVYDIDHKESRDKYLVKDREEDVDFAIHMVHGMLLDKPFIEGIPYTLVDDILDTKADITLSGHYHLGYKLIEYEGKYFINPGSLVRLTNSNSEIKRRPKCIILDLEKGRDIEIEDIYLKSAAKGKDILDRSQVEMNLYKEDQLFEFKQSIEASVDFNRLDINEILIDIASTYNIDEEVKLEALKRISNSQIKKAGDNIEIYK